MDVLSIDIGGTKFTCAAFRDHRMVLRESRPTDRALGPQGLVQGLTEIVQSWRNTDGFQADCCGIGFGGPVDFASQSVTVSTHVGGWASYPLVAEVVRFAKTQKVVMDNDANVGALGEARFGAGQTLPYVLYMTLSTGIGAGFVLDGEVYRGADSFAGEIGHMNLVPDGPDCLCGSNGCFERMCCGLWLERDYGAPAHQLMLDPGFVSQYVILLARGLKTALMILNPSVLVMGGGIPKAGVRLFEPLQVELERQMPAWSKARRLVRPARLVDDSVLWGGLALAQRFGKS